MYLPGNKSTADASVAPVVVSFVCCVNRYIPAFPLTVAVVFTSNGNAVSGTLSMLVSLYNSTVTPLMPSSPPSFVPLLLVS